MPPKSKTDKEYQKAIKPESDSKAEISRKQDEPLVSENDAPEEAHRPMPPKEAIPDAHDREESEGFGEVFEFEFAGNFMVIFCCPLGSVNHKC